MTTVKTSFGTLDGIEREQHLAFLGVPFAAPPVGELRFRAPQPPAPWDGVRPAREWGKAARQTAHFIPGFAASGPQDEDCLYLNVYTPALTGRRPVMFWIHGGGFTHGTAAEPLYNGGPLARRGDVVVVSINYRLGAFGYLYLEELLPGRGLSANCGQLDMIAALEWVRDNIEAFGGDPGNVTIFGESAGAAAVSTLLAMPGAKGLFHRAIMQSGAGRAHSPEAGARIAQAVIEELGLTSNPEGILTIEADRLLAAQTAVAARIASTGGAGFAPVADGETLLGSQIDAVRAGEAASIPVILGTNRDETKLWAAAVDRDPIDDAKLTGIVAGSFPSASPEQLAQLIATYRESRTANGLPTSNLDILDALQTDSGMRFGALRLAAAQRQHQPDTYLYLFTYPSPARGGTLGACHALELPFVFGTLDAPTQERFAGRGPDVERLSVNMMGAWLAFARSGNPGHEGIGPWPAFDTETFSTMVFDRKSGVEHDPFGEERRAVGALLR